MIKLAGLSDGPESPPKSLPVIRCNAETLTDVCCGGDIPEVEIVSLLEEQLPQYKLRADTLTEFIGYENQDWFVPCPLQADDPAALTPDQIRETLNYFLLCSNRVSQMTKTYNDIEAVTRLLEEKEKDLELTARIGKELLVTNQKLENTVAVLENDLRLANENITQLNYELLQKHDLIQILTNDVEQSEPEEGSPNTSTMGAMQYEVLQRKIGHLEKENRSLREETDHLCAATVEVEEAEQRLVSDLASQLSYTQSDLAMIEEDLNRTRSELTLLKNQNEGLTEKLTLTEDRLTQVTQTNTELSIVVQLARETQSELATELAEMKQKYAEVLSILAETQDLLKLQKKRSMPTASLNFGTHTTRFPPPSSMTGGVGGVDSLAAELECSLFSEFSLDSGIGTDRLPRYKKVFDTVRCSTLSSGVTTPRTTPSIYDSITSTMTTPGQTILNPTYPGECPTGIPGIPGSADLEAALRRLTPGAILARRTALSSGLSSDYSECPRTPDSIMSTGSSSRSGFNGVPSLQSHWKMPEKLQIVKPREGSQTLQHWSELATPSLSNILEERPGVKVRGSAMDVPAKMYTLADVEEDDDDETCHPGKQFQHSIHTYTLTNSTVRHPADAYTSLTPSSMRSSRMSTAVNSRSSSAVPSRRNSISTSTFSVTLSLAKVLHERGIQAATPSTLATPNYTPTATPCNSPQRSRETSPTRKAAPDSSSSMYNPFGLPGYLVASGAELLRRALIGPMNRESRRNRVLPPAASTGTGKALVGSNKSLTSMSIVEQLEKIGIDQLVTTRNKTSNNNNADPSPATENRAASSRSRKSGERPRVRADLGTVPFKGPSIGTLGSMRKGGLL